MYYVCSETNLNFRDPGGIALLEGFKFSIVEIIKFCLSADVFIYNRRQWPLCLVDYFYYNNVYADAQLSIRELSLNPLRVHCTEVAAAAMEKRANGQGLFYNRYYRAYTYIPIYVFCVHIFLVIEIVLLVGTLLMRLL